MAYVTDNGDPDGVFIKNFMDYSLIYGIKMCIKSFRIRECNPRKT